MLEIRFWRMVHAVQRVFHFLCSMEIHGPSLYHITRGFAVISFCLNHVFSRGWPYETNESQNEIFRTFSPFVPRFNHFWHSFPFSVLHIFQSVFKYVSYRVHSACSLVTLPSYFLASLLRNKKLLRRYLYANRKGAAPSTRASQPSAIFNSITRSLYSILITVSPFTRRVIRRATRRVYKYSSFRPSGFAFTVRTIDGWKLTSTNKASFSCSRSIVIHTGTSLQAIQFTLSRGSGVVFEPSTSRRFTNWMHDKREREGTNGGIFQGIARRLAS